MKKRGSGILLHPTSLPSPFGIGDFGTWAYRFADFLVEAGQSYWQILPLNPTDPAHYNSPYHSLSAFASSPLLISPEIMIRDGLLDAADPSAPPDFPVDRVAFGPVMKYKKRLFDKAYGRFKHGGEDYEYKRFCHESAYWLDDFALFTALKSHFDGRPWNEWPEDLRDRRPDSMEWAQKELLDHIERAKFFQYVASRQWRSVKSYANERGVQIIGDIPIYVNHDSVDVWAHPEFFKLDDEKKPYVVSGVPPDYFSETGQLWGNPIYRWESLREAGYSWWIQRVARMLEVSDFVRIDHFRGLVAFWEVPATKTTAIEGQWIEAPAIDLLNHLTKRFPYLPIIAEDLGVITPDVREVMNHFDFPGMKLLLFAFGEDMPTNPYIPHNLPRNCVAYTGTHDNNTVKGWFMKELGEGGKERLFRYIGRSVPVGELHWEMIRLVMMSVANTVIFPLQDILGLGPEGRMNCPATLQGNWEWRLSPGWQTPDLSEKLYEITETCGRT